MRDLPSVVLTVFVVVLSLCGRAISQEPSRTSGEPNVAAVVELFVSALDDPDRGVRCAAAMALETVGPTGDAAIPMLARRLEDPEWCVRMQVARALAARGDEATGALAEALRPDGTRERRLAAIAGLSWSGSAGLVALRPVLGDPDERLRRAACVRAGCSTRGELSEPIVESLRSLLDSSDFDIATTAAIDLAHFGRGDVGAEVLVDATRENPGWESIPFTAALQLAGEKAASVAPAIVELILESEARSLEQRGPDSDRVESRFRDRLVEVLASIGAAAREAIDASGSASTSAALERAGFRIARRWPELAPDAEPLEADDEGASPSVVELLDAPAKRVLSSEERTAHLASEDAEQRRLAIEAIYDARLSTEAIPVGSLLVHLEDEDAAVRAAAVRALRDVAQDDAAVVRAIVPRLDDGDAVVREMAIDFLCATRYPLDPAVVQRLRSSPARIRALVAVASHVDDSDAALAIVAARLDDASRDARLQAVLELRTFGARAVPALRRALVDHNWRVRRLAVQSLGQVGPGARAAIDDLVVRLADPSLSVSLEAWEALASIGPEVAPAVAVALGEAHYGVLRHAEHVFASLGRDATGATTGVAATGRPRFGDEVGEGAERRAAEHLAGHLEHADVNVREVAARCLGELGAHAAPAVPALVRALADPRVSVRGRAAVALGRIGREAAPALRTAAMDADARVRAGAVFALGRVMSARPERVPVSVDLRLPVVEPGPAEATGFVPSPEQLERARAFADAGSSEEKQHALRGLSPREVVDVYRAGLRSSDPVVAIACAAELEMENLDAYESERAVELLLPELFAPESPVNFERVYGYLGSAEVPTFMHWLSLSSVDRSQQGSYSGALHRILRWDSLPLIHQLDGTRDDWVLGGDLWMVRGYTERFRNLEVEGESSADDMPVDSGLDPALRALLAEGPPIWSAVAWLNDSKPGPGDAPLLRSLVHPLASEFVESARTAYYDSGESLCVVLRALGKVADPPSRDLLVRLASESSTVGDFARAALARRGDPAALDGLRRDAAESPRALALLLEVRPGLGAELLLEQIASGTESAPVWDFEEQATYYGIQWHAATFLGIEEALLAAELEPVRLARAALDIPGCRTVGVARGILAGLARTGPVFLASEDEEFEDEYGGVAGDETDEEEIVWPYMHASGPLLRFLALATPEELRRLLREWSSSSDQATRDFAFRTLLEIGDPPSADAILAWLETEPADSWGDRLMWSLYPFARSANAALEALLESTLEDPDADFDRRQAALVELAILRGIPASLDSTLSTLSEADFDRMREALRDGRLEDEVARFIREYEEDPGAGMSPSLLGAWGTPEARELLEELADRRDTASYPKVAGQLALLGDREVRAELWSAIRAGRYRWICYQNDYQELTLGWSPEAYATFLDETETNCCRGGHAARLFESLCGQRPEFGYEAARHQDDTPVREIGRWLRLRGGSWVALPDNRVGDGDRELTVER